MEYFLDGAITLAFVVIALFFLRFFRSTRDYLFLYFAIAFIVLGLNRVAFAWMRPADEAASFTLYLVRLAAFLLILWAIVDKNRKSGASRSRPVSSKGDQDAQ